MADVLKNLKKIKYGKSLKWDQKECTDRVTWQKGKCVVILQKEGDYWRIKGFNLKGKYGDLDFNDLTRTKKEALEVAKDYRAKCVFDLQPTYYRIFNDKSYQKVKYITSENDLALINELYAGTHVIISPDLVAQELYPDGFFADIWAESDIYETQEGKKSIAQIIKGEKVDKNLAKCGTLTTSLESESIIEEEEEYVKDELGDFKRKLKYRK